MLLMLDNLFMKLGWALKPLLLTQQTIHVLVESGIYLGSLVHTSLPPLWLIRHNLRILCMSDTIKDAYVRTYSSIINPIPDQSMWVHTDCDATMHHPLIRPLGRPKKARKKGPNEAPDPYVIRRTSGSLRCGNCQEYGHNSRICKWIVLKTRGRGTKSRGRGHFADRDFAKDQCRQRKMGSQSINQGKRQRKGKGLKQMKRRWMRLWNRKIWS